MSVSWKLKISLAVTAVLLFCLVARGQSPATEMDNDFRCRTGAGVDWKIAKGLHLDAGYELRVYDNVSRIERNQFNVGLEYSPIRHLEIGLGYCFIGHYDADKVFKPRHRVFLDASGSYKFGAWKLSLTERVQMTRKSYEINTFQQTPNLLELKSRLKISYKGLIHLEPYAYAELRNCLNGPSFTAEYNESTGKYSKYTFTGYSDSYLNRIRGAAGLEWKIDRSNSIDIRFMNDWCHDKAIDTNKEGTKLKSYIWEYSVYSSLAVGYVFSF